MKIGFAKRDITPPVLPEGDMSLPMIGWWWNRATEYREIHDPLYARAMAMSDGDNTAVVMSCDLFGDAVGFTERCAQMVQERCGLKPDHFLVANTHVHTSPDTLLITVESIAEWWIEDLAKVLAETAVEAIASMREGTLRWVQAELPGIGVNRRAQLVDFYESKHGPLDPTLRRRATARDDMLRVLWAVDADGKPFGAVANHAVHPVIVQTLPMISADLCGPATASVEKELGAGTVCIYLNGPSGDVNPAAGFTKDYADCEKTGNAIAEKVLALIGDEAAGAPVKCEPVAGKLGTVEVERQDVDEQALRERLKEMEEELPRARAAGKSMKDPDHPIRWLVRARETLRVAQMPRTRNVPVQAIRLGDVKFISFPGEMFTSLGQDVRSAVGGKVMLGQCARAHVGYICPREAFMLDGYEIGPGTWSWMKEGGGEKIADKAIEVARSL